MIGMGKPFGMGGVRLEPRLYLCNRAARYRSLFVDDQWETAYSFEDYDRYLQPFVTFMSEKVGDFYRHPRIRQFHSDA